MNELFTFLICRGYRYSFRLPSGSKECIYMIKIEKGKITTVILQVKGFKSQD